MSYRLVLRMLILLLVPIGVIIFFVSSPSDSKLSVNDISNSSETFPDVEDVVAENQQSLYGSTSSVFTYETSRVMLNETSPSTVFESVSEFTSVSAKERQSNTTATSRRSTTTKTTAKPKPSTTSASTTTTRKTTTTLGSSTIRIRLTNKEGISLDGVTIDLYASDSSYRKVKFLKFLVTDSSGSEDFSSLGKGCYVVVLVPPSDHTLAGANSQGKVEKGYCFDTHQVKTLTAELIR